MLKYNFFTFEKNEARISVESPFEMLGDISNSKLSNTLEIIKNINNVKTGSINTYSFGGSDYCILDVYKDETKVYYDFGESETSLPTNELIKLLEDWRDYLVKNGQ